MASAFRSLFKAAGQFIIRNEGSSSVRNALVFAGAGVALAILGAPLLQNATDRYAGNGYGIDRVMTGSIDRPARYTVRRSVLNNEEIRLCRHTGGQC